jgi:hypothetical protein
MHEKLGGCSHDQPPWKSEMIDTNDIYHVIGAFVNSSSRHALSHRAAVDGFDFGEQARQAAGVVE